MHPLDVCGAGKGEPKGSLDLNLIIEKESISIYHDERFCGRQIEIITKGNIVPHNIIYREFFCSHKVHFIFTKSSP